jgi:hypothetical protein
MDYLEIISQKTELSKNLLLDIKHESFLPEGIIPGTDTHKKL